MNTNQIPGGNPGNGAVNFSLTHKQSIEQVHPLFHQEAHEIDTNKDSYLSDTEIKDYLRERQILRDPKLYDVDEKKIIEEFKVTLQNEALPQAIKYHSYEEMVSEMQELQTQHPDRCKMFSIGKSHEGRDIWAMKVTKNPGDDKSVGDKHAVFINGATHAREWIALEVPLFAMKSMIENYDSDPQMKHRVDNAVTYFVPVVNPDGYTYSREVNAWWRKNRRPIYQDACDISKGQNNVTADESGYNIAPTGEPKPKGIGVDLNRNAYDGNPENLHIYRPPGDNPCSTWDDYGASDRISSDTYRGPEGASEPEAKALVDFQMNNMSIKGSLNFHSYGRMILYPPGYTHGKVGNHEEYEAVAKKMAEQIRNADDNKINYRVMSASQLYPATGCFDDFQEKQGILGMTVELGRSFAPSESEIEPICNRLLGAQMVLIDHVIENGHKMRIPA